PAASLVVSATSSEPTLIPQANIVLGGTDTQRTITVSPAANQHGTATITLTVTDGELTATDSFTVTVTPVNDGPTLSDLTDQSTSEDTATTAQAFSVSDIETPAATLVVTAASSNPTL